jgi:hypothetical protein
MCYQCRTITPISAGDQGQAPLAYTCPACGTRQENAEVVAARKRKVWTVVLTVLGALVLVGAAVWSFLYGFSSV